MRSKATLNKLISSKSAELADLEREIADLKFELAEQERSDVSFKVLKRLKKFEDLITDLRKRIVDFNTLRHKTIFKLMIDEDYISIVDVESSKKVANLTMKGSNDFGIREWLKEQLDLIDFYREVVSDYRKYLVDSAGNRLTLQFRKSLTFYLVKYDSDVEINVQRKMTKIDVIDELITRSRTPHEDRKYESDFWELNEDEFILIEEATFDRPAATIYREIEDILELFT